MASIPKHDKDAKPSWFRDLLAHGYAVVPDVVPLDEVAALKRQLREDVLAFTRGSVDMDAPSTWATWADTLLLHNILVQHNGVGHMRSLRASRAHARVAGVFAELWSTRAEDLLVSFDALSIHFPPEVTRTPSGKARGWFKPGNEWWHTDQGPRTPGDCVQVQHLRVTVCACTVPYNFMRTPPPPPPRLARSCPRPTCTDDSVHSTCLKCRTG